MKEDRNYPEKNHFLARLSHLAALQGLPHWSFDGRDQNTQNGRGVDVRVASLPGVRGYSKALGIRVRSLLNWIAEERQFHKNIRELRALDDHALRDIGLNRGDIAAMASRVHPAEELNTLRETLARPTCVVLEFAPEKSTKRTGSEHQLIDNAA